MDLTLFGLRILFIVLLYAFLAFIVLMVWRDLKAGATRGVGRTGRDALRLVVIRGGDSGHPEGRSFDLGSVTTIGREVGNDIIIADAYASSKHARVVQRDRHYFVEDVGSSNGTLHNGLRLPHNTPAPLGPGDVIQIGKVEFKAE